MATSVITVESTTGAVHRSAQDGTWLGAPLFTTTLCNRPIPYNGGWHEVSADATCSRCIAAAVPAEQPPRPRRTVTRR